MGDLGDAGNYRKISVLIITALCISASALVVLNAGPVARTLAEFVGPTKLVFVHLFFWAALGASISCSLFMAKDKEMNELESLKKRPDPAVLRYPDEIDVHLYGHRILTSSLLGVTGGLILYAALGYFDVPSLLSSTKHRVFFSIFSFLIGMYQGGFLVTLSKLSQRMFQSVELNAPAAGEQGTK